MAMGWVTSERLAVDDDGEVQDLTIRSFGVLRATETPPIDVEIDPASAGEPGQRLRRRVRRRGRRHLVAPGVSTGLAHGPACASMTT